MRAAAPTPGHHGAHIALDLAGKEAHVRCLSCACSLMEASAQALTNSTGHTNTVLTQPLLAGGAARA